MPPLVVPGIHLSVAKKDMADIPQRLYKGDEVALIRLVWTPHLGCGHAVRLGTWLRYFKVSPIKAFRDIRHVSVDKVFATGRFIIHFLHQQALPDHSPPVLK